MYSVDLMADGAVSSTVGGVAAAADPGVEFWRVPWQLAVHCLVGTLIFAIIAAFAVALDLSVRWLETYRISLLIVLGLEAAEYALFVTDVCLFAVFLWRTAKRTYKGL
jgi:hypothetical protein